MSLKGKSSVQLSMSNPTHHVPSKSSLTITLTEPLVILRTADVAGTHSHSLSGGVAPASAVRGLLALDLSKASRISNIEVELMAISYSSWSEGASRLHFSFDTLFQQFQVSGPLKSANSLALHRYSSALRLRPPLDGLSQWTQTDSTMLPKVNIINLHLRHPV